MAVVADRSGSTRSTDSSAVVLILSAREDTHATTVGRLVREMGSEPLLFDISTFPTRAGLVLYRGGNGTRGCESWLHLPDGSRVEAGSVRSVWWRRPQRPRVSVAMTDPAHRRFAINESLCALNGLWHSMDCRWVNPIEADRAAAHKPAQLKLAAECGLAVPDTLVTNEVAAAREFVDRHGENVVYKAFMGLPTAWRETRLLRVEERECLEDVRFAPLIFQELVEGRDLRVTVVGEEIFAAEMDTSRSRYPYDIRMDMTVPVTRVELADAEREALLRLVAVLGLQYGACDLRRRPDGELVFLELNPAGQFLHIEELTGLPIARALAVLLTRSPEKEDRHAPAPEEPDRGAHRPPT